MSPTSVSKKGKEEILGASKYYPLTFSKDDCGGSAHTSNVHQKLPFQQKIPFYKSERLM